MSATERAPGSGHPTHRLYRLTSLQIGDIQSYVSDLYLYLTCEKYKLFILVDNSPWLKERSSRPAQLWQLMVTKSRISPFASSKLRHRKEEIDGKLVFQTKETAQTSSKWSAVIAAARLHHKALSRVKDVRNLLHGCIVFEVSWNDVRGINYINELQTDTSIALEVKSMIKKEFDDIDQAFNSISSKCLGDKIHSSNRRHEALNKKGNARKLRAGIIQSSPSLDSSLENVGERGWGSVVPHSRGDDILHKRNLSGSACASTSYDDYKTLRRDGNELTDCSNEISRDQKELQVPSECLSSAPGDSSCSSCNISGVVDDINYKDVFIVFRFNDPYLPFELREVIISDLRLLRLLESGLPSWVLFFQSYPLFCKLYRPWMRPLASTLYVLISVVTVVIGFYDLYKNVPLLKATASHLFGPFFRWIEAWEMVSRLKYLGTMLFLQNFEKAFQWFVVMMEAVRQFVSLFAKPMVGPFTELVEFILPTLEFCSEKFKDFINGIAVIVSSTSTALVDLLQFLVWPFVTVFSLLLSFVESVAIGVIYPIAMAVWELFTLPVKGVVKLADSVSQVLYDVFIFLKRMWSYSSGTYKLMSTSTPRATTNSTILTAFRTLWNDLLSKVFRALRSIVYGFVAFFTACNRHRLSIYNHLVELFRWLSDTLYMLCSSLNQHEYLSHSRCSREVEEKSQKSKDIKLLKHEWPSDSDQLTASYE